MSDLLVFPQRTRTFYVSCTDVHPTQLTLPWFQSTSFRTSPSLLHRPFLPPFILKLVPQADLPVAIPSGVLRFPNEHSNPAWEA